MLPSNPITILNLKNVCRLCNSKMELVWIFDKKFNFPQTMRDIVAIITTVQIEKEDIISQKICSKCVAVAIKMFQFRDQSIRNDKSLQDQCEELLKNNKELRESLLPNTSQNPKTSILPNTSQDPKTTNEPKIEKEEPVIAVDKVKLEAKSEKPPELSKPPPIQKRTIDKSVFDIFKIYPHIKLPAVTLKLNINPQVTMELNAVENYFKIKKMNMDICVQKALKKPHQFAVKSTSASAKPLLLKQHSQPGPSRVARKSHSPKAPEAIISTRGEKRKRSSSSSSVSSSSKKPSSSPAPSNFSDEISDICGIATKSHELHVCNICNSVHYHAGALKRHQVKHLRCQFCKAKFKTLEHKDKHVEFSCKVQKAMKGMTKLPKVILNRLELNLEIRQKYPEAVARFPPIPGFEKLSMEKMNTNVKEIVSDQSDRPSQNSTIEKEAEDTSAQLNIAITDGSLNKILIENRNCNDMKMLKSLLSSYNKFHKKKSDSIQTILPTNELIKSNHGDSSIEMKSLKQHLYYYKIPIEINYNKFFCASYKYDSRKKVFNELNDWDNLVPKDVRHENDYHGEIKTEDLQIEDIHNESVHIISSRDDTMQIQDKSMNNTVEGTTILSQDAVGSVDMELEQSNDVDFLIAEINQIINTSDDNMVTTNETITEQPRKEHVLQEDLGVTFTITETYALNDDVSMINEDSENSSVRDIELNEQINENYEVVVENEQLDYPTEENDNKIFLSEQVVVESEQLDYPTEENDNKRSLSGQVVVESEQLDYPTEENDNKSSLTEQVVVENEQLDYSTKEKDNTSCLSEQVEVEDEQHDYPTKEKDSMIFLSEQVVDDKDDQVDKDDNSSKNDQDENFNETSGLEESTTEKESNGILVNKDLSGEVDQRTSSTPSRVCSNILRDISTEDNTGTAAKDENKNKQNVYTKHVDFTGEIENTKDNDDKVEVDPPNDQFVISECEFEDKNSDNDCNISFGCLEDDSSKNFPVIRVKTVFELNE